MTMMAAELSVLREKNPQRCPSYGADFHPVEVQCQPEAEDDICDIIGVSATRRFVPELSRLPSVVRQHRLQNDVRHAGCLAECRSR